ncbi:MAG: ABC transporter substrate-binding protein [Planctomycetes bacterium]|nr:ABC transporter substrate-binding protein [Planctomycetota bacterium]
MNLLSRLRSLPLLLTTLAAVTSLPAQTPATTTTTGEPIRVGIRARNGGADRLTSLRYVGGFETKTMLLETLVRRGVDGRIVPGLAARWQILNDGRSFRFELRPEAKFHDGTKVTAEAVVTHMKRWVNLPEHNWLLGNQRITGVTVEDERTFRVDLDRPYALLEDLLAINPCAVVAPSSKDWEGEFMRPIGTGPFRFVGAFDEGKRWRVQKQDGDGPPIDVTFYPRGRDTTPIDDLVAGRIDAFVGGWDEDLPAERLDALQQQSGFCVQTAPGSSVVYLSFRLTEGPTQDPTIRARIANAIARPGLIATIEGGRAEPCTTWAAPTVAFWPRGRQTVRDVPAGATGATDTTPLPTLKIAAGRAEGRANRAANAVAEQLRAAGFAVEVLTAPAIAPESPKNVVDASGAVTPLTTESGEVRAAVGRRIRALSDGADVRVEITHGMPYCPHQSLVARFGTSTDGKLPRGGTAELQELVDLAAGEPSEQERLPIYARVQDLLDREHLIVPLYVPWRVALHRTEIVGISLSPDVYHADLTGLRRDGR